MGVSERKMGGIETNSQGRKTSKLAIAAHILGLLTFYAGLFLGRGKIGMMIFAAVMVVTFVVGILALVKIRRSEGKLTGRVLAILGMALAVLCAVHWMEPLTKVPSSAQRMICATNLKGLGTAMIVYANDDTEGRYPTAGKWCDLLIKGDYTVPEQFVCRDARGRGDKGRCHYAMNPNCEPNSPQDVVLLFETKGGWNQVGGAELLTVENHNGEGCKFRYRTAEEH